jgi:ParB family chromosome partitioning protein
MNTNTATEYRNLPLGVLTESATNPRRIFEDAALKELAESIRSQGVLSPLLVRPLTDQSFEIVAGARRYRAAQMAEAPTVPVRIVNLTDAEALEAQLIENLQRRDVHPLEEAQGFKALLNLEDPKYSIEQIAAKVGKSPAYCAARVRLTELAAPVVEAFYAEEIGVGHALLLAKLQAAQQELALANCFREEWNGAGAKAKRILLPVRHLQQWIEHNVLLLLKQAPFNKRDPQLVPAAGSCVECPKRTGHNKLLFAEVSGNTDACTDPNCYAAKLEAHVKSKVAAKPELVQITKETAEAYEAAAAQPATTPNPIADLFPSDGSPVNPPKTQPVGATPALKPSGTQSGLEPTQLTLGLTWSGEVPSQKWMNFYTKVLTKLGVGSELSLNVKVKCNPKGGVSQQKIEEIKSALRELGLDDNLSD